MFNDGKTLIMPFDHEQIRSTMDRDFSGALFDALVDPSISDEERDAIASTLGYVDDPRLSRRLRDLVFDATVDENVRLAAFEAIEIGTDYFSDAERRAIWELGDAALSSRVLGTMNHEDVVLPIASDPTNPLYARALDALAFGFEAHQHLAIAALASTDPTIRKTAVTTVLWEEPIEAIPDLLACLRDKDPDVRAETENTLQYFPDRRVLRGLAPTPGEALDSIAYDFARTLNANPALAHWMDSLLGIVEPARADANEDNCAASVPYETTPATHAVDADAVVAALFDLGGQWDERRKYLRGRLDWESVVLGERDRLGTVLRWHPDPEVRMVASNALASWDASDLLLDLIDDPNPSVAKSAIYALSTTTPNGQVAADLQAMLRNDDRRSSSFNELLGSFVHHADPTSAVPLLVELISATSLASRIASCIGGLDRLGADDELRALAHLLHQDPRVSWDVHVALLGAYAEREFVVHGLPDLDDVDDLGMAEALVRYHAAIAEAVVQP